MSGAGGEAVDKFLVINADDFGLSRGINRGVLEAHRRGVVTSASLMVEAPRCAEAVALARDCPGLGLGLHFTATDEEGPLCDLDDVGAVGARLASQFRTFVDLAGAPPTHLDSHHHVHRRKALAPLFVELARRHGIPLRKSAPVTSWGFYAQWKYGQTDPRHVSVETLCAILAGLPPGAHEIGCHPGYVSDDFRSVYHAEREMELKTLTDPAVRQAVARYGIVLLNYRELRQRLGALAPAGASPADEDGRGQAVGPAPVRKGGAHARRGV